MFLVPLHSASPAVFYGSGEASHYTFGSITETESDGDDARLLLSTAAACVPWRLAPKYV